MSDDRPQEVTEWHTRILRLSLSAADARAYFAHVDPTVPLGPRALLAFEQRWFGAKSLERVYRSQRGATLGDLFMSLIHTTVLRGGNPLAFLAQVQRHAQLAAANPAQCLPGTYRETLARLQEGHGGSVHPRRAHRPPLLHRPKHPPRHLPTSPRRADRPHCPRAFRSCHARLPEGHKS